MSALITIIRNHWIFITLFLLAVITLLSLTPLPNLPSVPGNDKIHHFLAYAILTFSVVLRKPKYWILICLLLFCWSGAVELLQPYVNRYGEWRDMVANGTGIMCGLMLAMFINRLFPASVKGK
jgi:VanZ family protein